MAEGWPLSALFGGRLGSKLSQVIGLLGENPSRGEYLNKNEVIVMIDLSNATIKKLFEEQMMMVTALSVGA